jgi:hypothetical protein
MQDIIMVMKPRTIKRTEHVARMGRTEMHKWLFCYESLKERDHLENIEVEGRIILKRILNK